ncbi:MULTISPECIES: GNAT family N-acetyltransferase [unclassified Brachybacterium]|uniref:GNAT family N-acetyltransferase n=1 Tax=unclassified Brachybacterium TaxID=2623841 RepID=UPI00361AE79E
MTGEPRLETDRLLLRPWRPEEAGVQRQLWSERDPRVPPHRRIDADGHPTVAELEDAIRRRAERPGLGLLAVVPRATGEVVGYCGLTDPEPRGERRPELAVELLAREHGQGYATEAGAAVLEWAWAAGHSRLWATVWDWNAASRRVLEKLGFVEIERSGRVGEATQLVMTVTP